MTESRPPILRMESILQQNHPGISPIAAKMLIETATLCLTESNHDSKGTALEVRGYFQTRTNLGWRAPHRQAAASWDRDEATEYGATGIAVLLVDHLTGERIIQRSRKGPDPGFDYWLGEGRDGFKNATRLEVSGIRQGSESQIRSRLSEKLRRMKESGGAHPAGYVFVTEFSRPVLETANERGSLG